MTPEEEKILSSVEVPAPAGPETPNVIKQQLEQARNRAYFSGYEAALKDMQASLQTIALGIAEAKKSVIGS